MRSRTSEGDPAPTWSATQRLPRRLPPAALLLAGTAAAAATAPLPRCTAAGAQGLLLALPRLLQLLQQLAAGCQSIVQALLRVLAPAETMARGLGGQSASPLKATEHTCACMDMCNRLLWGGLLTLAAWHAGEGPGAAG